MLSLKTNTSQDAKQLNMHCVEGHGELKWTHPRHINKHIEIQSTGKHNRCLERVWPHSFSGVNTNVSWNNAFMSRRTAYSLHRLQQSQMKVRRHVTGNYHSGHKSLSSSFVPLFFLFPVGLFICTDWLLLPLICCQNSKTIGLCKQNWLTCLFAYRAGKWDLITYDTERRILI